jgi:hypothetical protein
MTPLFEDAMETDIGRKVLDECTKWLSLIGASYAIKYEGEVVGELKVAEEVAATTKKQRTDWSEFTDHIKDLKVGSYATVECPPDRDIRALQCALTSTAAAWWGNGTYKSQQSLVARSVTILRLG